MQRIKHISSILFSFVFRFLPSSYILLYPSYSMLDIQRGTIIAADTLAERRRVIVAYTSFFFESKTQKDSTNTSVFVG